MIDTPSPGSPGQVLPAAALSRRLARGQPCLFPTDTVPALAARPDAVEQLWILKDRPAGKPLILMGADVDQLQGAVGGGWLEPWLEQAERCWPGPVTLVLPIASPLTQALHPGGASLGLRVPACPMALDLLRLSGPLATTSVNRSGEPSALTAEDAAGCFPDLCRLGPVPWPPGSGTASTVLEWDGQGGWRTLRPGERPAAGSQVQRGATA